MSASATTSSGSLLNLSHFTRYFLLSTSRKIWPGAYCPVVFFLASMSCPTCAITLNQACICAGSICNRRLYLISGPGNGLSWLHRSLLWRILLRRRRRRRLLRLLYLGLWGLLRLRHGLICSLGRGLRFCGSRRLRYNLWLLLLRRLRQRLWLHRLWLLLLKLCGLRLRRTRIKLHHFNLNPIAEHLGDDPSNIRIDRQRTQ